MQGKEAYQLLHALTTWDLLSGAPAEYMGKHDLPVDSTVVRDSDEWQRWNNEVYDEFMRWWCREPGHTKKRWTDLKQKYGLRGGYPGLCGLTLPPIRLVVVCERLHARSLGLGRTMMLMAATTFTEEALGELDEILLELQPPESLWYPGVGFMAAFLKGEEHRLLHEAWPLCLELCGNFDIGFFWDHFSPLDVSRPYTKKTTTTPTPCDVLYFVRLLVVC